MSFFDRLSTGWKLSMQSFSVLKNNKQLILFPVLSSIALIVLCLSFLLVLLIPGGWNLETAITDNKGLLYTLLFFFYFINYFIVIFFNMALIHCARIYFQGGKPTVSDGLRFSMSKLNDIIGWSVITATVGLLLKILQENGGKVGEIVAGLIGIVWSVMTFFVVPVIAYENLSPMQAVKRSTSIMKEKWGESVGASFSFGLAQLIGFIAIVVPCYLLGMLVNFWLGVILAILGYFILASIISAAQTIFISAVYHKINDEPAPGFDNGTIDSLFIRKEKGGFFS